MYLGFLSPSYEEQKVGSWDGGSGLQLSADNQPVELVGRWAHSTYPAQKLGMQTAPSRRMRKTKNALNWYDRATKGFGVLDWVPQAWIHTDALCTLWITRPWYKEILLKNSGMLGELPPFHVLVSLPMNCQQLLSFHSVFKALCNGLYNF